MPKRETEIIPGEFYHIFNRGNGKQDIFYNDRDRYRFLQAIYISNNSKPGLNIGWLERHNRGYTLTDIQKDINDNKLFQTPFVRICTDCLMPNHFHFLLQEIERDGVVRFMQRLGNSYAKYFSIKYERPGSLFQGRFKSVVIKNNDQLKYLLAYINVINPIQLILPDLKEKGIKNIEKAWEFAEAYNWGAHQEYMGRRQSILIDKGLLGEIFQTSEDYQDFVKGVLLGKEYNFWQNFEDISLD